MRIGLVHTVGSPCRCAESVLEGLQKLNYEPFFVDSAEIEIHAPALAQDCDLVLDHTDTYRGRGLYRPLVRLLLETCGARVVGSSAKVCFIADNKAAAKERLAGAGIPVPPGIVVHSKAWTLPGWLRPPLLLKPAFEHMSRGIRLVKTEEEAHAVTALLLQSLRQPILVESYIAGRELAVSILAGPGELEVLPILEWGIGTGGMDILTEDFKLINPADETHKTLRPALDGSLAHELEELALSAFRALDLQDYGRFDIRLSPGGSIFFLEANTTPSLEPMEALAVSAGWAGLDYAALIQRLLSAAQRRHELSRSTDDKLIRVELPTGPADFSVPQGVHLPPQSTIEMAGLLDIRPGEDALELGCGCGLLSIAMAKLGARRVVATDLDPNALQATQENARRNGVGDRIELRAGSWYEAISEAHFANSFDLIVATPPQTPGRTPFGPKYGGPDGTGNLFKIIKGAADFLNPEHGRLWLIAVSLANPRATWDLLAQCFLQPVLVRETQRPFTAEEYEAMAKGLFDYLRSLRSSGVSDFAEAESGRYFNNLFIRAAMPRKR